ncbi:MAG TPA: hypothetical protein VHB77_08295 [Planctomycetaceae bacterium]|nr:hypothetical protein [Planctomycetaceae bacterium]
MSNWAWLVMLALGMGQVDAPDAAPPKSAKAKSTVKTPKKTTPKHTGKTPHKALPTTLSGHVAEMLNEGFTHGPNALRTAQREHAAARRLSPDDPLVEYAFGLVQSRQLHNQAALTQFKLAVERGTKPFWPAWEALIWADCCEKRYSDGLGQLVKFAELVQKNDGDGTGERHHEANWIGQVLEGLDETLDTDRDRTELATAEEKILATLDAELRASVDQGRAIVREKYRLLSQQASDVVEQRSKQDVAAGKEKATQIDSKVEEIGKEREANVRTREQWATWIEEQIPPIEKQLTQLERDYLYLDRRLGSLSQSIALANQELLMLETRAIATNQNPNLGGIVTPLQLTIQNRKAAVFGYQLDYNATAARMASTVEQAGALLKRRALAVEQYETATGQLMKKNNQLERWSIRLGEKKKKLQHQVPAKDLQENFERNLGAFRTYVELDLEAERVRILNLLGAEVPNADDPPAIPAG